VRSRDCRSALPLDLAVAQVEVDADAGVGDPLERVGDLVERPTEPALLHDDEDLERRPRAQGVHEGKAAGALHELRARDPVVSAHVGVGHHPALFRAA